MTRGAMRAAAVVLCVALGATPAHADTASEADLQFALGSELYKHRQYEEALQHFIASNRLVPNRNVVFNIASIYGLLKRDADAYNWYETYLQFEGLDDAGRERGVKAQATVAARVAVIDVSTTPPGADLFIDRVDLGSVGVSPRRLAVPAGERSVVARLSGHHEARGTVTVTNGAVAPLRLDLPAIVGVLVVESTPTGASVHRDDGTELGATPLHLTLPVGELHLIIAHDGFAEQSRTVTLRDGAEVRVEVTLAMTVDRAAVLTVQGDPAGAQLKLDGRPVGAVPFSSPGLTPGSFTLSVDAPGYEGYRGPVLLEAGAATRVDVHLVSSGAVKTGQRLKWAGYGLGAAALIAGICVGVVAITARGAFYESPTRAGYDAVGRENTVADGLMIGGAVVLVATLLVDLIVLRSWHSTGDMHVVR